jgi:hypothetical protein
MECASRRKTSLTALILEEFLHQVAFAPHEDVGNAVVQLKVGPGPRDWQLL